MFVYLRISTYVEIFISVALKVAHDPPSGSKLAPLPDVLTRNGYHVIPLNASVTIGVFSCMSSLIPLRFVLPQSLYHQPINISYQKSRFEYLGVYLSYYACHLLICLFNWNKHAIYFSQYDFYFWQLWDILKIPPEKSVAQLLDSLLSLSLSDVVNGWLMWFPSVKPSASVDNSWL